MNKFLEYHKRYITEHKQKTSLKKTVINYYLSGLHNLIRKRWKPSEKIHRNRRHVVTKPGMPHIIKPSQKHKPFKRHNIEHQRHNQTHHSKYPSSPWVSPAKQTFQSLSLCCHVPNQTLRPPRKSAHSIIPD